MTGRILTAELLPMTLREIRNEAFPRKIEILLNEHPEKFCAKESVHCSQTEMERYLVFGGLPGICFQRTSALRQSRFRDHINTILSRDLRLIVQTTLDTVTLRNLLVTLAKKQGEPIQWSNLCRSTRISRKTLPAILSAFEALFLIRWVSSHKTTKPVTYYFEDQGLASYLTGYQPGSLQPGDLTRFIYANFRAFFYYDLNYPAQVFEYRTRGGACVPLVFQTEKTTLGILPIIEKEATRSAILSANSFLDSDAFGKNKRLAIAHTGDETKVLAKNLISLPWQKLI